MADFLVIYGTTHGHSAKIADALAHDLRSLGATAEVADAAKSPPSPAAYRAVVVAASVHAGYQSDVARWLRQHLDYLGARPTAFVSVCPGVLQHDPAVDSELEELMARFFEKTGWTPRIHKTVAGALPYSRYNAFKRWMMRRLVRKALGDTDMTGDYDYTDWADLSAFARTLMALISAKRLVIACPIPSSPQRRLARGA